MAKLRFPFLAAALCVAGVSFAQTNALNGTPAAVGPFPPQPGGDPSLFRTLPPEAYRNPAQPQPGGEAAPPAVQPPATARAQPAPPPVVVVVPDTGAARQQQLERAALEAQAAQAARTPTPINGAFTGQTDERFR